MLMVGGSMAFGVGRFNGQGGERRKARAPSSVPVRSNMVGGKIRGSISYAHRVRLETGGPAKSRKNSKNLQVTSYALERLAILACSEAVTSGLGTPWSSKTWWEKSGRYSRGNPASSRAERAPQLSVGS